MAYRKAEYAQIRENISTTICKYPDLTARTLADRFGVSVGVVNRVAKTLGVKLPESEMLTHAEVSTKMPHGRIRHWGFRGIYIERKRNHVEVIAGGVIE